MKKVSIIITTHNRPDLLFECLNSVIEEGYENIEVVIVDDCPEYPLIIKSPPEPIKKVYHNKYNMGISLSRNKGFQLSSGDYVKFLDDDDKIIPGALTKQVYYLDVYPEIDVVYSDLLKFKGNDNIISRMKGPKNIPAGTPLIRRETLKDNKFSEKFSHKGEDSKLWRDLLAAGFRFSYYSIDAIMYRIHDEQMTNIRKDGPYKEQ